MDRSEGTDERKRDKIRKKMVAVACLPLWLAVGVFVVGMSLCRPSRVKGKSP